MVTLERVFWSQMWDVEMEKMVRAWQERHNRVEVGEKHFFVGVVVEKRHGCGHVGKVEDWLGKLEGL